MENLIVNVYFYKRFNSITENSYDQLNVIAFNVDQSRQVLSETVKDIEAWFLDGQKTLEIFENPELKELKKVTK